MKKPILSLVLGLVVAVLIGRCGSSSNTAVNYIQIEQLARPALNEGLLTNNDLLSGFNLAMPAIDLTSAVAGLVLADAAKTLKAIYRGARALGLTPPHSSTYAGALDGDAAETDYINTLVGAFLPDVMRIVLPASGSTGIGYNQKVCGTGDIKIFGGGNLGGNILCGGRKLGDDVMDITLSFLIAADPSGTAVKDGVDYPGTGGNLDQQGKVPTTLLTSFPYVQVPY